MNKSMPIALPKDCYAHEVLDGAYNIWQMVQKGERDIKIESLLLARDFINKIEKELQSGGKRK